MSDPTVAVQRAIMAALRGIDAVHGVFDFVPASAVYPYLTVQVTASNPIDEECWDRTELVFQIDVWSIERDSAEVKTVAAEIRDLLHEKSLAITGFVVDRMRVDGAAFSREEQTLLNRARTVVTVEAQPS